MKPIDYKALAEKLNETLALHSSFARALKEVRRAVTHAGRYDDSQVFIVLGESRSGKTRVLQTLETEFPTTRTKEHVVMPVVRISVPKGATTNGVLSLILDAMGDKLTGRWSETEKIVRVRGFVETLKVKAIVIDEFQQIVRFRSKNEYDTADALKVMADLASINLVVAGLAYARAVFNANTQLAGRARAPVVLRRFDWNLPEDRGEFIEIVAAFAEQLRPLRFPNFRDEAWGFRWFCATGGLVGYVAKIFKEALDNAEEDGARKITMEDLDVAQSVVFTRDSVAAVRPFTAGFAPEPTADTMRAAWDVGRDDEQPDVETSAAVAA